MLTLKRFKILLSLGNNYPIISEIAGPFSRLMFVISAEGESWQMSKRLDLLKRNCRINPKMTEEDLTDKMGIAGSYFCEYQILDQAKDQAFLKSLSAMVSTGKIDGEDIINLPVVLMDGLQMNLENYKCFIINGEEIEANLGFCNPDEIIPQEGLVPVLIDRVKDYVKLDGSMKSKLQVAACCLPECISNRGILLDYLKEVDDMVEEDDVYQDQNGLVELFLSALYNWQEKTHFSNVIEIPDEKELEIKDIGNVILFDHAYLYMQEKLYKEIIKYAISGYPIDASKKALRDAGVLVCDKTNTYVVKLRSVHINGEKSIRMLKLERKYLQRRLGDLDFIMTCLASKGVI